MKAQYVRAMDAIHRACVITAGVCLIVMALIIPWGVFTRYVLNSASSWPEPLAVLLMIILSFLSAIVCYRDYLHIGVNVIPGLLEGTAKRVLGWMIEACMLGTNFFMLWWGLKLVETTWYQSIPEFPAVSAGMAYLPIPIGGLLTVLFVIERLWAKPLFQEPTAAALSAVSTE